MSENQTRKSESYMQVLSIRPFVREWIEAILNNPGKIELDTLVATGQPNLYVQTFAPAGKGEPYARARGYVNSRGGYQVSVSIVSNHVDDEGKRVEVKDFLSDEKESLEAAFRYWIPEVVAEREEKERKRTHEQQAILLAKLPAFTNP